MAAAGATLLAFPEYRDGTLSADALSRWLAGLGRLSRPLPLDVGLALLRVPPEELDQLRLPVAHRTSRAVSEQLSLLIGHRPAWECIIGESTGLYRTDRYERAVTWRGLDAPAGAVDRTVQSVLDRRDPCRARHSRRRTASTRAASSRSRRCGRYCCRTTRTCWPRTRTLGSFER